MAIDSTKFEIASFIAESATLPFLTEGSTMRVSTILGLGLLTYLQLGCASSKPEVERRIASGYPMSANAAARIKSGKAPQVICSAYEYYGETQVAGVRHQRLNLATKTESGILASLTVLETSQLKFVASGSINSEDEMSLSIANRETGHYLAASVGSKNVSLSIGDQRDNRRQAWMNCWEEALLRQHYLNGICNIDGTVASKDIPSYSMEAVVADCKQLKKMGVF